MSAHSSILGGSTAGRLLACPASYQEILKSPVKDVDSVYAQEGTLLHDVIAEMIKTGDRSQDLRVTDAQHEVLLRTLDLLDELKKQYGGKFKVLAVEKTMPLPGVTGAFGTVDVIFVSPTVVLIADHKFGQGVPVKAVYEDTYLGDMMNPQLAFCTASARHAYKRRFKGKTIVCAIVQPRLTPPISHTETNDLELDEFLLSFHTAYLDALGKDPYRERGEHCRFAPCKATCELWTGPVFDLARLDPVKAALQESVKPSGGYPAFLSHALHLAEMAETWVAEIRKQAHNHLSDGGQIPDWKLIPKRGTRKWTDETMVAAALGRLGANDTDMFGMPELRSPAQMEKALKPKGIVVPDDLWQVVSSGTTIAPADDPRPTVTPAVIEEEVRKALARL